MIVNEIFNFGNQIKPIIKNCRPFLNQITRGDDIHLLFRGMNVPVKKGRVIKKHIQQKRKPLNTSRIVHKYIDSWFEENFGHNFRSNAYFGTGDLEYASKYGVPCAIFPAGKFKYVWSPKVNDLFGDMLFNVPSLYKSEDNMNSETAAELEDYLKRSHYVDSELISAIKSGNEIMVYSETYYAYVLGYKDYRAEVKKLKQLLMENL